MLNLLIAVLSIIITLAFVIGIHELGHFFVARLCGVKVLRFSIGFGKKFFSWHDKQGTEYVLAAFPLGGYVKMLDETEGDVAQEDLDRAYNRKPLWQKMAVVVAGPLANFVLAFFLYWIIYVVGFYTPTPIIGSLIPQSIAEQAKLKPFDEILKIDNKRISSWSNVAIKLLFHIGDKDTLLIEVKPQKSQNAVIHSIDLKNWQVDNLRPDPLKSLGIIPYQPPIPAIIGDSLLEKSSFETGDHVISIDNHPISDWYQLTEFARNHPGKTALFEIKRKDKTLSIPIDIQIKRDILLRKIGYLGVLPAKATLDEMYLRKNQYGFFAAIPHAYHNIADIIKLNFIVLGKMAVGKVSLQSLGGPITIFESAGSALLQGLLSFMGFLAFLSVSIGMINILPIPGLDGGHILFQIIEAIRRKPLSQRVMNLIFRLGFILLLLLIAQAITNDLMRL